MLETIREMISENQWILSPLRVTVNLILMMKESSLNSLPSGHASLLLSHLFLKDQPQF